MPGRKVLPSPRKLWPKWEREEVGKKLGLGAVGKIPGLGLIPPGPGALAPEGTPHPLGGVEFSPGQAMGVAQKFRPGPSSLTLAKRVLEHNPSPKKFGGKKGM